jgi:hypothetical protein
MEVPAELIRAANADNLQSYLHPQNRDVVARGQQVARRWRRRAGDPVGAYEPSDKLRQCSCLERSHRNLRYRTGL